MRQDACEEAVVDGARRRRVALLLAVLALGLAARPAPRRDHEGARCGRRAAAVRALAGDATRRLDLNTASRRDLVLLPAVGPETARAAKAFRTVVRPFVEVRDLSLLPGISENRLAEIRPYVEVAPP